MDNIDFNYFCQDCPRDIDYRRSHCFTNYRVKRIRQGEYIVFRGDRVHDLEILVEGSITVLLVLESGVVIRSTPHRAPYPIGALALFDKDSRYRVDILCDEESTFISVDRESIERQMVECRQFMRNFIAYTSTKFDIIMDHVSILMQRSVRSKLAYYILFVSRADGSYHFVRGVKELAHYMCVERPSLSRAISQLVEQGMITYDRGRGEILDSSALTNLII